MIDCIALANQHRHTYFSVNLSSFDLRYRLSPDTQYFYNDHPVDYVYADPAGRNFLSSDSVEICLSEFSPDETIANIRSLLDSGRHYAVWNAAVSELANVCKYAFNAKTITNSEGILKVLAEDPIVSLQTVEYDSVQGVVIIRTYDCSGDKITLIDKQNA